MASRSSDLMVATDGGIFNFSSKPFDGSLGGNPLPNPIIAVAPSSAEPAGSGGKAERL